MGLFEYSKAIVRSPARSVTSGLRAGDHAGPEFEDVAAEHAAYVAALREIGLAVDVLPALEDYPDSIFVEDPALVFTEGAILLNPGAPSRRGEVAELRSALESHFENIRSLEAGYVDGGDILITPGEVIIGLSGRTDAAGAASLAVQLDRLGYRSRVADTPKDTLHLKTACALIAEDTVVLTASLDAARIFDGFRRIVVPEGEEAAANLLRIRDTVLIGAAYPRTRALVDSLGIRTIALSVSEIAKIDAGLSCMSLRWR